MNDKNEIILKGKYLNGDRTNIGMELSVDCDSSMALNLLTNATAELAVREGIPFKKLKDVLKLMYKDFKKELKDE